ncbi:hypothetical protein DPMN_073056 [Dreissena polymorpha]|uniref:Uncharacterized protein n=1 Tax=Dreissena polymorpha TaxID=45954 RepID=A0A9D4BYG9_DREPO|nr:hypothetical protein DPMN_073056 [Dreissena polymorpha]
MAHAISKPAFVKHVLSTEQHLAALMINVIAVYRDIMEKYVNINALRNVQQIAILTTVTVCAARRVSLVNIVMTAVLPIAWGIAMLQKNVFNTMDYIVNTAVLPTAMANVIGSVGIIFNVFQDIMVESVPTGDLRYVYSDAINYPVFAVITLQTGVVITAGLCIQKTVLITFVCHRQGHAFCVNLDIMEVSAIMFVLATVTHV